MPNETVEQNLSTVMEHMNAKDLWDSIYVDIREDEDGVTYAICDDWDNHNKFVDVVKKALDIQGDDFSDWNVEKETGIVMVFSDEYTTCSDCGKVIRTSPDSYHWQPEFYLGDGFIVCKRCFDNESDYQEAYIEEKINNPKNAVNGLMTEEQIEKLGFEELDVEYENGWYSAEDDPEEIYNKLSKYYDEILFFISNVEQFRINFIVFVRGETKK